MSNVHQLKPRPVSSRYVCSACGIGAACDCGAVLVSAGARAAAAVRNAPHKSDRAIAAEIGVDHKTVGKARQSTGDHSPVTRTGLDGKVRRLPGGAPHTVDIDTLSPTAKQKLDAAIRQEKRKVDTEHAARMHEVDEEVRLRVIAENKDYLAMVKEQEVKVQKDEKLWREMIDGHRSPFNVEQFKVILMCLHPDGERTADKLADAFRLFNSKKLQLTGAKASALPHI